MSKYLVCFIQGYLHALGMARTAQVKRDARIGEAEAKRDSGIKVRKYNQFIYLLEDLNVNNLELYLF